LLLPMEQIVGGFAIFVYKIICLDFYFTLL
jgi:hypothetical protein